MRIIAVDADRHDVTLVITELISPAFPMFVKKSVNINIKKKKEIMKRNLAKLLVKASSSSYLEKIFELIKFKKDMNGPHVVSD
jgi:hypothetical protein